jgi:hypothetical protein
MGSGGQVIGLPSILQGETTRRPFEKKIEFKEDIASDEDIGIR